ncbi:sulfite exporter TauE/SafE family protein [Pseudonocardia sp. TRM90224]|uniref:sulfite exporter TauE/SafE family protein n=1 Tax=Pseudonocardia sp. TRM90224 TaxID=2812678 RepID=UPI001E391FB3|nr:sulfite exporter TauE/SafE family protein [Pseudonocardia sp. TRM90224]
MVIALAGVVVTLGALVQGSVGFGLALVAAPLMALLDPTLVPVPLLLLTSVHAVLTLSREHTDTHWAGVGWALLGRVPGVAIGAMAVALLPVRLFIAVVAIIVLACAGLSALRWSPRPTVPALLVAGVVSGAGGTAASIGGPPVALLYQAEHGARVRATMAAYFTAGSVLSVGGLALAGAVTAEATSTAALLLPFMIVGFLLSGPARRFLDRGWVRPAVLTVAGGGAIALLVAAAIG